jgi:hypothetical protein
LHDEQASMLETRHSKSSSRRKCRALLKYASGKFLENSSHLALDALKKDVAPVLFSVKRKIAFA